MPCGFEPEDWVCDTEDRMEKSKKSSQRFFTAALVIILALSIALIGIDQARQRSGAPIREIRFDFRDEDTTKAGPVTILWKGSEIVAVRETSEVME